ncbi:MAG: NfeD family protein [Planctomycetia bacterium]|nr:NfeD family protein [Planctomycetia bacterium]
MSLAFWVIVSLAAAVFFGILEVFVPSMGLLSVIAGLSLIAAVVLAFELNPFFGFGLLVLLMIFGPLVVVLVLRVIPKTPFGRRFFLETEVQSPEEVDPLREELRQLVGTHGRTLSLMMPSGKVLFGGKSYEAVSEAGAIDPNCEIIAVRTEGVSLFVRPFLPEDESVDPEKPGSPLDSVVIADPFGQEA